MGQNLWEWQPLMKDKVFCFLAGLTGSGLTLGMLFFMNSSLIGSDINKEVQKSTSFKLTKTKKIIKKIKKTQKKRVKKNLKPKMNMALRGNSFGLPAFDLDLWGSDLLNADGYVSGDSVDIKPRVVHRPDLSFPEKAMDESVSGFVTLGVFIDDTGRVEKVEVLESQPKGFFEEAAKDNLKEWRFKPAVHKGAAVSTWQEQKVVFNQDGDTI